MRKVQEVSQAANYCAATMGQLSELNEHVFVIAPGMEVPGKVFIGEALQCTGAELSMQMIPAGCGGDFLHTHTQNEELYLVLKGQGEFQVDAEVFPISEGSVIRVAPEGKRAYRNTGDEPMIMACIQSKQNSLTKSDIADGVILNEPVVW